MIDRSRLFRLVTGAALGLAVLGSTAGGAWADLILADGKWVPPPAGNAPVPGPDDEPTDEHVRESAPVQVDAAYDVVKNNRGFTKPTGAVKRIVSSDRVTNTAFNQAMNDASSSYYQEAAEGFAVAAGELTGFGKQLALYYRVQMLANLGEPGAVLGAIDDLLAAFPKSYFFVDVQVTRAKIALSKNDTEGATKALEAVKSAPGMNARDALRAEWTRIYLTLELGRKYEDAAAAYRTLVAAAEKAPEGQGEVTKQRALVGLGSCLVMTRKESEAKAYFDKATDSRNSDVLAGAYNGLGNVAVAEAKALREANKLPEAKAKLEEAVLHYLRVSVKYKTEIDEMGVVLDALGNLTKVFATLFEMSGNKNCEIADRCYKTYVELVGMMDAGPQKNALVRDAKAFDEKRKAAGCGVPPPGPTAPQPPR